MQANGVQRRLLIVDDEPNIALAVKYLMESNGFLTQVAYNGELALAKARDFAPHLVILDVMMPGIDGFQVAGKIRSFNDKVFILFLTAKGQAQDKMNGYDAGGDLYLTKPFDNDELVRTVAETLQYG